MEGGDAETARGQEDNCADLVVMKSHICSTVSLGCPESAIAMWMSST